ncbi:MAG TPA: hypothetical protein VFG13_03900 [Blastococcus sp.]|nr:hypothetical protein [Blastococcus sp.]
MRTYDPADHILYVHLAQDPAVRATPPPARDVCHRLPAGYANASPRAGIGGPRPVGARPAFVLLPGGGSAAEVPTPAAPALQLLRNASGA